MKISDIAAAPLDLGAALGRARVFHPSACWPTGHRADRARRARTTAAVQRDRRPDVRDRDAGDLPEIAGLAWRMPPMLRGATHEMC